MGANGVRLGGDGRLEVVRTAPPEEPEHLRSVLARLRAATGPGIVEVVSSVDDGDHVEVVLAFAGRPPAAPMGATELTPIASSVASHLADLHLRGLAHGALAAEHVLVDASGAVRLCGLAVGTPDDDVVAFGALVDALLDPGEEAPALRSVIARCAADDAAARPSMAALAAALATTSPRRITERAPAERRRRSRRPVASSAVIAAVGAIVALASVSRAESPPPASTTTTTTATTSTSAVRAARVWPASPARTVEHDGATWAFGTEADVALVLGDWDCDGVDTPLLVDRAGDVYVVDEWTDELSGRLVASVPGATSAAVERGPSCDRVVVTTPDGAERPTVRA